MTKTCTICVVSGERVIDNRGRAELFAALHDALCWCEILFEQLQDATDHELPLGVASNHALHTDRWVRALAASPAEVAVMLREMAEGGE